MRSGLKLLVEYLKAKLTGKPFCAVHAPDGDGIACAALIFRKYPNAVVILMSPKEMRKRVANLVKWDVVADLPRPKRCKIWIDHHASNAEMAKLNGKCKVYFDDKAPCAAVLMLKALSLEGDRVATWIAEMAAHTDNPELYTTPPPTIEEKHGYDPAWDLNDAVKGLSYSERIKLAKALAREGVNAFRHRWVREAIRRHRARRDRAEAIANRIKPADVTLIVFNQRNRYSSISPGAIAFKLYPKGAKIIAVAVPKKVGWYIMFRRAPGEPFSVRAIAERFGGGGHDGAAAAKVGDLDEAVTEIKKWCETNNLAFRVESVNV